MIRPLLAAGLLLVSCLPADADAAEVYLGIRHEVTEDGEGLRVAVVHGSPADSGGLVDGDVIIAMDGTALAEAAGDIGDSLGVILSDKEPGDIVRVTAVRSSPKYWIELNGEEMHLEFPEYELPEILHQLTADDQLYVDVDASERVVELEIILGSRPGFGAAVLPPNSDLACDLPDAQPEIRRLLAELNTHNGIEADFTDLLARLDRQASIDDGYKLSRVAYLLRDGLKGEGLVQDVARQVEKTLAFSGNLALCDIQQLAAGLLDLPTTGISSLHQPDELECASWGEVVGLIDSELSLASDFVSQAFAAFTPEELEFIANQRDELTDVFAAHHYVDTEDDNPVRIKNNLRLIELARKVDYESLLTAQVLVSQFAVPVFARSLRRVVEDEFGDELSTSKTVETPAGYTILIGSKNDDWHKGTAPDVLIEPAGNDFYTLVAREDAALQLPICLSFDLAGNDAYESTTRYSQGSGSLGCALLVDTVGNDQYTGLQWCQGSGFFGCGSLVDMAGDDEYRAAELSQAAAIFGTGVLLDMAGDDRFCGQMKCQAFGGSLGVGLLIDVAGNDYRYCKGKYPTGYGDPGIFDSWGQGCAQGFRGISSGGIAGVIDMSGADYSEAGNFSQGGGYYFGLGFYADRSWEADQYVGSRYNQGFCAHQAVGVFLESGGNDTYSTRQSVAQGLAWDESCTMFVDYGGDDVYDGGTGFSLGASAHNSLCIFLDAGGRDSYHYPQGPARAGSNDYHGGTSLSLFIDSGGARDFFTASSYSNNIITGWPEHGFFCDLPAGLGRLLASSDWLELWQGYGQR